MLSSVDRVAGTESLGELRHIVRTAIFIAVDVQHQRAVLLPHKGKSARRIADQFCSRSQPFADVADRYRCVGRPVDVGIFGRAGIAAEPAREGIAIAHLFGNQRVQPVDRLGRNLARVGLPPEPGIAIAIIVAHLGEQVVGPVPDQLGTRRRAKTDRIGHAIFADRNPVMRDPRRHIEDIARL